MESTTPSQPRAITASISAQRLRPERPVKPSNPPPTVPSTGLPLKNLLMAASSHTEPIDDTTTSVRCRRRDGFLGGLFGDQVGYPHDVVLAVLRRLQPVCVGRGRACSTQGGRRDRCRCWCARKPPGQRPIRRRTGHHPRQGTPPTRRRHPANAEPTVCKGRPWSARAGPARCQQPCGTA